MASKSAKKKPNSKRSSSKPASPMASSKHFDLRRFFIIISIILPVSVFVVLAVSSNTSYKISSDHHSVKIYGFEIVNEFPHDPSAFTQGLLYAGNESLFESTGLYKRSSVRKVAIWTGKVEILHKMPDSYFGEGLTFLGERLFQVTWLTQTGFTYNGTNLQKLDQFTHQMKDGWGLATDGKILYGSDGTSTLYDIDPQTLKATRKQVIKFNGREVRYLNELEYINGEIWANVWQTDCIARISPDNGRMLGWILLPSLRRGLLASGYNGIDVLNGIAWDSDNNRIFVTGKLWPKLYEIKIHPARKHFSDKDIEQHCIP
ncbi:ARABIDOPSIS THALIANA GLUTAMINYL CYCLASE, glutaminyl cyclase, GLUTAMINYL CYCLOTRANSFERASE [Hibiscus trionum]|uniref:ARABIDOPSIS THALIANA GLUTAMINYL CYCLASE, glutaminyl cyclase, GLUTAMINYL CYCLOTRANSFERASE n=1 Tax=Hibiscus trionum TaxID=183268 RepID=A0A9W7JKV6_HIBTR|nr:ARABIDOPSIS THALIANA GLUTAMINYL CYCLASE, glutaminyl cyclase, GLUTAMINYL CYCLOTRANSFERASE [Hibiscus trionum]